MSSKSGSKSDSKRDASRRYIWLRKDNKLICRTKCINPPLALSPNWATEIVRRNSVDGLNDLPQFNLYPSFENSRQHLEWNIFLPFLYNCNKVAFVEFEGLKMYILPCEPTKLSRTTEGPKEGLGFTHAVVAYKLELIVTEVCDTSVDQRNSLAVRSMDLLINEAKLSPQSHAAPIDSCFEGMNAFEFDVYMKGSNSDEKGTCSSISKCHEAVNSAIPTDGKYVSSETNFVRTDPSYLKTLGQAHSGWLFGAIAELVDNSRDAKASRLEISVENIYEKTSGCEIPMLSIIDDGQGMNHKDILRLVSFGLKQTDEDNLDRIGKFGIGFKTGSMRLGRDALVLTQTTQSRSIAFLSQTLNVGKDNLEIPIVSYLRQGQCMECDTSVQSASLAKYNLKAIKEFSPFNEYLIGEKAGLFQCSTGTQIYIWNLDKWGSDYSLEWQAGLRGGSSFHQGDIFIRSRRVRARPGQTSRKVHLDYSLRAYLEVVFSKPRMKIFVQGSQVKSQPLANCLNNTEVINEEMMGKPVSLILGRSQIDFDDGNSGMFLYWHGRLIEAYKRVGGMVHSSDMGRGVIGVIDVSELMDDVNGGVGVHNNKQGFLDCELYACLEEWLGRKADEYWDKNFDLLELKKNNARRYKPDNEWVQCEKCRKWRMLNTDFDSIYLPKDWFCYMEPFKGKCEMPEEKAGRGVVTVGTKRSGYSLGLASEKEAKGRNVGDSNQASEDEFDSLVLKRQRTGPPRATRK